MQLKERLLFAYNGGKTKRFHTSDTFTEQTVSDHSFGVAILVTMIHPRAHRELIMAALCHDLAEHQVGDVSAVVKRQSTELKTTLDFMEDKLLRDHSFNYDDLITKEERFILKLADNMDGMMYCVRERRFGGRCHYIFDNYLNYTVELMREDILPDKIKANVMLKIS